MRPDVIDLRGFYTSGLGQMAQRQIRRRIRQYWPDLKGQTLLGLGFATPYLRGFKGEAARTFSLMPAAQGVVHWPREGPNATALVAEDALPLPDAVIDRVLLIHEIETAETVRPLLREVWRVLAPQGRLLAVVPNRRSLWSRSDATPFGTGRPFSRGQLTALLRDAMFTPGVFSNALYAPPAEWRLMLRWADGLESLGERWTPRWGGVHVVEASKQIYAALPRAERQTARRFVTLGADGG